MPSWNIHIAHVERLLAENGPSALGIHDANCFLFGNLVPDIYVGYLVKPITKKIPYRETHFADPSFVPEPRYWEFWERYGIPSADETGQVSDVVLGAWCHLMADHVYNAHNNAYLKKHGIKPGEDARIRKQADFDSWGRTLVISHAPEATANLVAQAAAFPQYAIAESDVRGAVRVVQDVVRANRERHIDGVPEWRMLDETFFAETSGEAQLLMEANLKRYAADGVNAWSNPPKGARHDGLHASGR